MTTQTKTKAAIDMPQEAITAGALVRAEPIDPMVMLRNAVEKGLGVDTLDKLMGLQQRWEATEARKAFTRALSEFKAKPPTVTKTKKAGFDSKKTGDRVDYKYATLAESCAAIAPALSRHGLSYTWEIDQSQAGLIKVTCVLTHELGHSERVSLQAGADSTGAKNSIQAIGSTVSYLERYTLLAATGVAASDQDDDAASAEDRRPSRAEFNPYLIVPSMEDGKTSYTDFGVKLLEKMKTAKSLDEIGQCELANDALLADCKAYAPRVYARLIPAIKEERKRFEREFTVIDLDHAEQVYADAKAATDALLAVFQEAAKRSTDQLEAMWEANTLSAQLRDAGETALADLIQSEYGEILKRTDGRTETAQPAAQAENVPRETSGNASSTHPAEKPPQASAEGAKASPAATAARPQPVQSPFHPKAKDRGPEAWIKWCQWFRAEVAATPRDGIEALCAAHKRELTYVQAYLLAEHQVIEAALKDR